MHTTRIGIIILLCIPHHVFAGALTQGRAVRFIRTLLDGDGAVREFVDADDLRTAHRLGIRYEGVPHKFLISYDIDESVKDGVSEHGWRYTVAVRELGEGFSRLIFSVPAEDYEREFYFKGPGLVSPISYLTRDWHRAESRHFVFFVSDAARFNDYCIDNLERFFETAADVLRLDDAGRERLEREKVYYVLCRDQEEIERLTGFHARGMFVVAHDFIVTTFSAHYHELMHLLVNYRLREVPLYTHPFLLEGFAVAFGGRGGREPEVILRLGSFLYESGMVDYADLLTKGAFNAVDPSISYPASGLYNLFLVEALGIDAYLALYRRHGGTAEEVDRMSIPEEALPDRARWRAFLDLYGGTRPIDLSEPPAGADAIHLGEAIEVRGDAERYYFGIRDTVLIGGAGCGNGFRSGIYGEIVGDGGYRGEKYLITADEGEVSIYNLCTGNLVANHVASFSVPFAPVPSVDGFRRFSVRRHIFDETLTPHTPMIPR